MFYKGHLYKGHGQNFEKSKGQTIVIPGSLRDKMPPSKYTDTHYMHVKGMMMGL